MTSTLARLVTLDGYGMPVTRSIRVWKLTDMEKASPLDRDAAGVVTAGEFYEGPCRFQFRRGRVGTLVAYTPGLAPGMGFAMLCPSWEQARAMAPQVAAQLARGETPQEGMFKRLEDPQEEEIPPEIGEILFQDDDPEALEKAAGHKYIRRVPTGKRRPKYRYYYTVTGGAGGIGHDSEFVEGSAFRVARNGKQGHFHITGKAADGRLTIRHDESGESMTLAPDTLRNMLQNEHATKIGEHHGKLRQDIAAAAKSGSSAQQERLSQAAKKYGVTEAPTLPEIVAAYTSGGEAALTPPMLDILVEAAKAKTVVASNPRSGGSDETTRAFDALPFDLQNFASRQYSKLFHAERNQKEAAEQTEQWRDPNHRVELFYGGDNRDVGPGIGDILQPKGPYPGPVVVTKRREQFIREEGLSFGLRDDRGWSVQVTARPATEDEARRWEEYASARDTYNAWVKRREQIPRAIVDLARKSGEHQGFLRPPKGSTEFPIDSRTSVHIEPDGAHLWYSSYHYDMDNVIRAPMSPEVQALLDEFNAPKPERPTPPTAEVPATESKPRVASPTPSVPSSSPAQPAEAREKWTLNNGTRVKVAQGAAGPKGTWHSIYVDTASQGSQRYSFSPEQKRWSYGTTPPSWLETQLKKNGWGKMFGLEKSAMMPRFLVRIAPKASKGH